MDSVKSTIFGSQIDGLPSYEIQPGGFLLRFLDSQKDVVQKLYMVHALIEFLIGASIAILSQYTFDNLRLQTPITCILLLSLYGISVIATFKTLSQPITDKMSCILHVICLIQFVIGISMFFLSFEMFLPTLFGVSSTVQPLNLSQFIWFNAYMGTVSALLLACNPSVSFSQTTWIKLIQLACFQMILINLFPFHMYGSIMPEYSPIIYGIIALINNLGVIHMIKKHREIMPRIMSSIGIEFEESGVEIEEGDISWQKAFREYVLALTDF
ncbi:hypothetical protein HDU82_007088 [Entophlyctis luteolus]|nr:hypothetical protein HDU82_007088 [Entophlyctis luteolus]